jgi:hypothetical protein
MSIDRVALLSVPGQASCADVLTLCISRAHCRAVATDPLLSAATQTLRCTHRVCCLHRVCEPLQRQSGESREPCKRVCAGARAIVGQPRFNLRLKFPSILLHPRVTEALRVCTSSSTPASAHITHIPFGVCYRCCAAFIVRHTLSFWCSLLVLLVHHTHPFWCILSVLRCLHCTHNALF